MIMHVNTILKKLAPLIGERVTHWRKTLPLLNPKTRELVEREIVSTAFQILGNDFQQQLLLPPPPQQHARGHLHVGTIIYEQDKWPFSLQHSEALQNLAIFGRSGSGKTNLAFHFLQQLIKQQLPFLFLDWKRTARHLLPQLRNKLRIYTPGRALAPLAFNPLIPPPELELHLHTNLLLDVLGTAYTLGDGSKHLLQRAITAAYGKTRPSSWPTIADVLQELEELSSVGRATGWKTSALRALHTLQFSDLFAKDEQEQEELVRQLTRENTVIEFNGLNENAKRFLIPTLLLWIYHHHLGLPNRESLRLVIFVEEAHHVLRRQPGKSGETVMERLLRQCREIGIAIVVVDQHPSLISQAALGNTYTTITLNLKDPSDINRAAGLSLLTEEDKQHLSRLPVGHGIVKLQDRWQTPFLVRFPHIAIEKGSVTDEQLAVLTKQPPIARSEPNRSHSPGNPRVRQIRVTDITLEEGAFALIQDTCLHPNSGVRERYKRLGWSMDKGTRTKNQLVNAGLLDTETIPIGRTRKTLLRPTAKAHKTLKLERTPTRESIAHEFWKHHYAKHYQGKGYDVQTEAPRTNGRVDIQATNANERVAIEIETGKSTVAQNVRNCLASRYNQILVIATNKQTLTIVEQQLAKAGLLIPQRIQILHAPQHPPEHRKPYIQANHPSEATSYASLDKNTPHDNKNSRS